MTWILDNGTVVLSNFVMEDEECSADRLNYWGTQYLPLVWNMTGTAECCSEDDCNDTREKKDTTTEDSISKDPAEEDTIKQDTTIETTTAEDTTIEHTTTDTTF